LSLRALDVYFFFFQAEDGIRDGHVTGVQTCALPISLALATGSSFPGALREALRDRAHPLTGAPGTAPEEPRAVERAEVREVVNRSEERRVGKECRSRRSR